MKYAGGDIYKGQWDDDKLNGCGMYKHANDDLYEGEYIDSCVHGYGILTVLGEPENVYKSGKVVYTFNVGDVYDGEWHEGECNGQGIHRYADGSIAYEGIWKDNLPMCSQYSIRNPPNKDQHTQTQNDYKIILEKTGKKETTIDVKVKTGREILQLQEETTRKVYEQEEEELHVKLAQEGQEKAILESQTVGRF